MHCVHVVCVHERSLLASARYSSGSSVAAGLLSRGGRTGASVTGYEQMSRAASHELDFLLPPHSAHQPAIVGISRVAADPGRKYTGRKGGKIAVWGRQLAVKTPLATIRGAAHGRFAAAYRSLGHVAPALKPLWASSRRPHHP